MRKIKTLSLMLLIMVFVFTAACSKTDKNAASDPPSTNKVEDKQSQPDPPAAEEVKIDLKGQTITILQEEAGPKEGTEEGDLQIARIKEMEKKYNCKIVYEVIAWGEARNKVANAGLSGEPAADIVLLNLNHAIPLINQGLLQPVDDYFDFKDPKWPKGLSEYGKYKEKMYGFNSIMYLGTGIYYNKTLFKREGLPDPHDLVDQGKWTWDTFLDIAKKATKDTDGDGVIDQWGIANHAGILASKFIYSNNGKLIDYRDGKFVFTQDDPNMLETYHFLGDLYNTYKVAMPSKSEGHLDDYKHSQEAFMNGKVAMVTGETWEGEQRAGMSDQQGFVYLPKGPKAADFIAPLENYTALYMPTNAKHPKETAIIWQDMILWDHVNNLKREKAEAQHVADDKDIESLVNVSNYLQPLFLPIHYAHYTVAWGILEGKTPESQLEGVKQEAQEAIDQELNTGK